LILTACLFLGQLVNAQQYPVQIVPQLLPPYTLNVSDYYNGTNEKLVKLSDGTALTDGQKAAKAAPAGQKFSVRSTTRIQDVNGKRLPSNLTQSSEVKKAKFVEIRGDGQGAYQKVE
jgi:hypothetical protein